jgi:hypothetical protein
LSTEGECFQLKGERFQLKGFFHDPRGWGLAKIDLGVGHIVMVGVDVVLTTSIFTSGVAGRRHHRHHLVPDLTTIGGQQHYGSHHHLVLTQMDDFKQ